MNSRRVVLGCVFFLAGIGVAALIGLVVALLLTQVRMW